MGRVVADCAVTLIDVIAVLREAGSVEQCKARGVGAGKWPAVDVDGGLVAAAAGVERFEGGGVGAVDFERLTGEGVQVVHLVVPDVVAGAVEQ